MTDGDRNFLNNNFTSDESWGRKYDSERKLRSLEWRSPSSPKKTNVWSEKSRIKTMLIAFFDSKGLTHKEFLPQNTTLNAAAYAEVVKSLLKRMSRVRPEYSKQFYWTVFHNNARPHTALVSTPNNSTGLFFTIMLGHTPPWLYGCFWS
ncbi:mariner Mos1 transposase [Trichonephila clavipes]|nr:mariner Mos1 transposase [Trichonephila clavipes]